MWLRRPLPMANENDKTPDEPAGNDNGRRRAQVAAYFGMGPEPEYGTAAWFDWVESLYQNHDWKKVPRDWKPGDPTAEDLKSEAIRKANEALARIIESSRGGRST
jgi:hypothetical protein